MLFSPRDYVVSPAFPGYAVVQIHKSPEGLSPNFVTDYATWEEASRKVHLLALMEGVHAWARRDDEAAYCELVMAQHPHAPWPEPWYPFDQAAIEQHAPHAAGLYVIGNGRPTFVGETGDLRARLSFHRSDPGHCLQDVTPLLFSCKVAPAREETHVLLKRIIRWWRPACNSIA
jgi:hypothetical protein